MDEALAQSVQDDIERDIKSKFEAWRLPDRATRWDHSCKRMTMQILKKLEIASRTGVPLSEEDGKPADMQNLLASFDVTGFCIHRSSIELAPILDSIHNTGGKGAAGTRPQPLLRGQCLM